MEIIATKLRRWGNSFGVVIPSETVIKEKLKENDPIEILIVRDASKVMKETFGMLKGKTKKTAQQMKDELREDLYN